MSPVSSGRGARVRVRSALHPHFCAEASTRDVGVTGMGPAHLRCRWSLSFRCLYRPLCLTTVSSVSGAAAGADRAGPLGCEPASAIAPVMQPWASHHPVFPFCYLFGGDGETCLAEWPWRWNRSEQEFGRTRGMWPVPCQTLCWCHYCRIVITVSFPL